MNNPGEILESVARDLGDRIVASLGEANVRSVFLSGSVVDGDVASFEADGVIELLSDIDLYVVVQDSLDLTDARRRVRDVVRTCPAVAERYRMLKPPDVGVFDEADLLGQAVRPGTVSFVRQRREIFGEPMGPVLEAGFVSEKIDPGEALYLLENRLLEISDAWARTDPDASEERYAHYLLLKGCSDIVTAVLVSQGCFPSDRALRLKAFMENDSFNGLLPEDGRDLVRDCSERLDDLQASLAGPSGGDALRERVQGLMIEVWHRIARRRFGSGDLCGCMEQRAAGGAHASNVRELLVLARRAGLNRLRIALGAAPSSRFSPVALLRLSGLFLVVQDAREDAAALDRSLVPALDRLTRLFGYDEGDLFERARSVRKAVE